MTKQFFIYAPPLKGVKKSNRRPVQPPYANAPSIHCSVYYYWWEYLRRHIGYRAACERADGQGRYGRLYRDFGDVHAVDFWTWWKSHIGLFAEPVPRRVEVATDALLDITENTLLVAVPLENKASFTVRQFKRLLEPLVRDRKRAVTVSRAQYPVASKPHLPSLHQHLAVWDAKLAHPSMDDWELADVAGIPVNQVVDGLTPSQYKLGGHRVERAERIIKRRKQLIVQRHLRIAAQYIENVGRGQFPLRTTR
jgi:hypothetical protein